MAEEPEDLEAPARKPVPIWAAIAVCVLVLAVLVFLIEGAPVEWGRRTLLLILLGIVLFAVIAVAVAAWLSKREGHVFGRGHELSDDEDFDEDGDDAGAQVAPGPGAPSQPDRDG